ALYMRRMSIACDYPQPRRKGMHLAVATDDVVELRLRGTNLPTVLEERRHPVGRLVRARLARRGRPKQAFAGREGVRRAVPEEGVRVRASGLARIDDRVVHRPMAERTVAVEVAPTEGRTTAIGGRDERSAHSGES